MTRFGVEVECGTYYPEEVIEKFKRIPKSERNFLVVKKVTKATCTCCGDTIENVLKVKTLDPFRVKRDGSLAPGFEINTPILTSMDQLDALRGILEAITRVGAEVNDGCGIHVHVENKSAMSIFGSPSKIASIRELWAKRALTIEDRFKPFEKRQRYCSGVPGSGKSCAINITNRPTLEFRIFNSNLDINYVRDAVKFCLDFNDQVNQVVV